MGYSDRLRIFFAAYEVLGHYTTTDHDRFISSLFTIAHSLLHNGRFVAVPEYEDMKTYSVVYS
jgi:hypothetical protein